MTPSRWWDRFMARLRRTEPVQKVPEVRPRTLEQVGIDETAWRMEALRRSLRTEEARNARLNTEKMALELATERLQRKLQDDQNRTLQLRDELNEAVKRAQVAEDERDALKQHLLREADEESVRNLTEQMRREAAK